MDETNDAMRQITATFKKDREDSNVYKSIGEAVINKIETKVDRLLSSVSYVGRYTEDDGTTSQNLIDVNDTSVVCAAREE